MNKRGRPAGSVSYIAVKLSDLNKVLKQDAVVLVDRRYGALLGANTIQTEEVKNDDAGEVVEASTPLSFSVS